MTDQEMNKLGDIIVAKIVAMQEQLDAEFFKDAQEQFGETFTLEASDNVTIPEDTSLDNAINGIAQQLQTAVALEDYVLAAELQQQLFDLYDQLDN